MNTTVFEAINITKKYRNTLALNQVSIPKCEDQQRYLRLFKSVYRRVPKTTSAPDKPVCEYFRG